MKVTPGMIRKRLGAAPIVDADRAVALVVLDALLAEDPRIIGGDGIELRRDLAQTRAIARREYLRHFPRTDDIKRIGEYVTHTIKGVAVRGRVPLEFVYSCLFCREPITSLGNDGNRAVHPRVWRKIDAHTNVCACAVVLGADHPNGMEPAGPPRMRRSKPEERGGSVPVSSKRTKRKRSWPAGLGPGASHDD